MFRNMQFYWLISRRKLYWLRRQREWRQNCSNISIIVCVCFYYWCFVFSGHSKALELLQGLYQHVWLVFSHLLSSVHHPPHAQCRGFIALASRGDSSFNLLDWISPLSPEVHFRLQHSACIWAWCLFHVVRVAYSPGFPRFEGVGIYVVMFGEIMKTLVRIVTLFVYLMLAFSLAFHALMLNRVWEESTNTT